MWLIKKAVLGVLGWETGSWVSVFSFQYMQDTLGLRQRNSVVLRLGAELTLWLSGLHLTLIARPEDRCRYRLWARRVLRGPYILPTLSHSSEGPVSRREVGSAGLFSSLT